MSLPSGWDETSPQGVWRFGRSSAGPSIGLVAGIHGDEPGGVRAVTDLLRRLSEAPVEKVGELIVVLGHPPAIAKRERHRNPERDLNRLFRDASGGESWEHRRVEDLKAVLATCDVVVDLHETTVPAPIFALAPATSDHLQWAGRLGIEIVLHGAEPFSGGGMLSEFVNRRGGIGLTVETGKAGSQESLERGARLVHRLLRWCGFERGPRPQPTDVRRFELVEVWQRRPGVFEPSLPLDGFHTVFAGDVIGTYDGEALVAPHSFTVIGFQPDGSPGSPLLYEARELPGNPTES